MAQTSYTATPSQFASAAMHLETRIEHVRVDGVRYAVVQSGTSGRVYYVRADASACDDACIWWTKTRTICSHLLALELAAMEDELRETASVPSLLSLRDLYPGCAAGCGELLDSGFSRLCDRCLAQRTYDMDQQSKREADRGKESVMATTAADAWQALSTYERNVAGSNGRAGFNLGFTAGWKAQENRPYHCAHCGFECLGATDGESIALAQDHVKTCVSHPFALTIQRLLMERGDYVAALEQIRSAPLARESSIQRYKRCRDTANDVLDKHKEARR